MEASASSVGQALRVAGMRIPSVEKVNVVNHMGHTAAFYRTTAVLLSYEV